LIQVKSLFQQYIILDYEGAWGIVKKMIYVVHECRGIFVINWQNTGLQKGSKERKSFEWIIGYCQENEACMENAKKICLMKGTNGRY